MLSAFPAIVARCCLAAAAVSIAAAAVAKPPSRSADAIIASAKAEMLRDPAAAFALAVAAEREAIASLPTGQRRRTLAVSRWYASEALVRLNRTENATGLIANALQLARQLSDAKLIGDVLLSQGTIFAEQVRIADALDAYQDAFRSLIAAGDTRGQAIALQNIANLYADGGDHVTAERYYSQSESVFGGDPILSLTLHNNRAVGLKAMERYPEALDQYRQALALARRQDRTLFEARILANMARVQLAAGDVDAAERIIDRAMALPIDSETQGLRGQLESVSAQVALQRGRLRQAAAFIRRSFADVDLKTTQLVHRDAHATAYEIFSALGDVRSALPHLEALRRLTDEQSKVSASTNTALMAARFDFANQELRIARLKAEELRSGIALERSRVRFQQILFASIGGAALVIVALLSFGIVTLRRSRDKVRAANAELAVTNTALTKALAAKTEFLATTSHEIRTPLNGILGMTQVMLADAAITPAHRDRVGVVHSAGLTMRALVDDILDLAKMETGNLTIASEPTDLPATLRDVSRLWIEQARGKGLAFELDVDAAPGWIETDSARLRQTVFNLLSNAIKFTERGTIGLSARASDDGSRLLLRISDTGIGIPADRQGDIFESFRQADASTTRRFGGTGLGLTICRNLARALGGDIHVDSGEGEGSVFTVDLPLKRVDPPATADTGDDADGGLLIVDGNPIARAMLRTLLAPRVGTIRFADNAAAAIEALATMAPDYVLVDDSTVRGEAVDGAGFAGIAQAARTHGAVCAVLWRDPTDDDIERLEAAGANRVIAKPIAAVALATALFTASPLEDASTGVVSCAA